MIFAVGLPRCGGQSLQQALAILHPGRNVHHSIEAHRWDVLQPGDVGAVEVFAPLSWLLNYPGGPHQIIVNTRDVNAWLASCERVYPISQQQDWNHPIWRYPLPQFAQYSDEYHDNIERQARGWWSDINYITVGEWGPLCEAIDMPIPDVPFPRLDRFSK